MTDRAALAEMAAGLSHSLKKRLLLWGARWLIGFAIIAGIAKLWPSAHWLWLAGSVAAGLSLLFLLVLHVILQRRIAAVQAHLAAVELLSAQIGESEDSSQA